MDVLHLTERNIDAAADHAASLIKRGGIAAVPTDTVYGLVGDALRPSSVGKIYRIKARAFTKALPIFVRDIAMAQQYAYIERRLVPFLQEVWPGPTTIILRKKDALPDSLTGGTNTIGMRIPASPFIAALLARFDNPLAETSANISGSEPATTASEVQNTFMHHIPQPELVVDGGKIESEGPSAVLDLTRPDNPKILRMGSITKEKLDEMLAQWNRFASQEGIPNGN
ncbi:threonylcarbamoyl-AMP synthase [Candidatus Parcubacteria bacterium]|nr:MAG: threonylcarbamoyl-AMP synthase [Candidatus Parcubacteria bacterium]